MLLARERELIAEFGRRMTADRLVVGTSGNLSIRSGDLIAVTPTGHAYDTLTPELVCVHGLDGSPVEGELAPTSELPIHQLIYGHTDAAAVVHTHSTAATVVSTVVDELPTIQVAYDRALYLEWVAEVWLRAHALGPAFTPRILDEAQMAEVYAKIQGTYATTGRPRPPPTR